MSDAANLAKAERELSAARATLAEHVEENLSLHRRCIELEEENAKAQALIDAMERGGQDLLRKLAELRERTNGCPRCGGVVDRG